MNFFLQWQGHRRRILAGLRVSIEKGTQVGQNLFEQDEGK